MKTKVFVLGLLILAFVTSNRLLGTALPAATAETTWHPPIHLASTVASGQFREPSLPSHFYGITNDGLNTLHYQHVAIMFIPGSPPPEES